MKPLYYFKTGPYICGVCLRNLEENPALSVSEQEHIARQSGTPLKQVFQCVNSECPQFKIAMLIKPLEASPVFGFTGFAPIPYHGEYDRVPRKSRDDEPFCGHCGARKK